MSKLALRTIASGSIELGKIPFGLYCSGSDGKMVLFCNKGLDITTRDLKTLRRRDRSFSIKEEEAGEYLDYVSTRLDTIVQNENMRLEDKTEIIHGLGKRTIKSIFENPQNSKVLKQSQGYVNSHLELLLQAPEISEDLFQFSANDPYLAAHSVNVCTFCLLIGEKILGRNRTSLRNLGIGGFLLDIGKAMIPKKILNKPGRLTNEEFEKIKKHTEYGYEIGQKNGFEEQVLAMIRSHHERMDGSGYPDGLQGDEIPPFVRIAAVADVYDAITTKRAYSDEKQHFNALEEMAVEVHLFDLDSFNALIKIVLVDEKLIRDFQLKHLTPKASVAVSTAKSESEVEYTPPAQDIEILREQLKPKFMVKKILGQGGMATVYLGFHTSIERQVAIKVLPRKLTMDEDLVKRFMQEARSAGQLDHPNIIDIFDIGLAGDLNYFIMAYLPGGTLKEKLRESKKLSWPNACKIIRQLCGALNYAHDKGVIHRDIKPDNVMFDEHGNSILTDFGIARATTSSRLTATGVLIGTPNYMSPEQFKGEKIDHRSDVYSLGILFYEILTGEMPFIGEDNYSVGIKHIQDPPVPPSGLDAGIPQPLSDVVLKMIAKSPEDRYQDARQVEDAVATVCSETTG